MSPASDEQPASGHDSSHSATCLTMGPCILTADLVGVGSALSQPHHDGVASLSYQRPHSLTPSPELPPPRA